MYMYPNPNVYFCPFLFLRSIHNISISQSRVSAVVQWNVQEQVNTDILPQETLAAIAITLRKGCGAWFSQKSMCTFMKICVHSCMDVLIVLAFTP